MVRCCLAYAVVVVCSSVAPHSSVQAEPRAVVELFTSQGCSSCPAADKLLGELADDPSLVPLSMPIDYWDYLGWKDTLADPRNTARQRAYSHVRDDGQVYTPQVVVNGSLQVLGSDKAAIDIAARLRPLNFITFSPLRAKYPIIPPVQVVTPPTRIGSVRAGAPLHHGRLIRF